MQPRILFFSPYAFWNYHTGLEATWAHAAHLRGADVRFVTCDGVFSACGIFREAVNPRPALACVQCQARVAQQFLAYRLPYAWLGSYLPRSCRKEIDAWVRDIAPERLIEAIWEGRPVGQWARSSVHSQFRMNTLDLANPRVVQVLRDQVASTARAAAAIPVLLDEEQPTTVALLNGRFFAHWAMIELCRERGIRFVTHERGLRKNSVRFSENARTHELDTHKHVWQQWSGIALDQARLAKAWQVLADRRAGRNYSWQSFSPPPQEVEAVRRALRLDDRQVVAVYGSSEDETAAFDDRRRGAFPNASHFLPGMLALAKRHPEYKFVLRIHPNLKSQVGTNHQGIAQARKIAAMATENVHVVMPDAPVSSYTLGDIASVGVVYASTMGLELAATGLPVLCMAQSTYSHTGCVRSVDHLDQLIPAFEAAAAQGRNAETARAALRWSWLYFRQFAIPFPLVREEPQHHAKLQYANLAALEPHRDPTLDRIAAFLMGQAPVLPGPTSEDRARSTADEDRFLEAMLARKPDALVGQI